MLAHYFHILTAKWGEATCENLRFHLKCILKCVLLHYIPTYLPMCMHVFNNQTLNVHTYVHLYNWNYIVNIFITFVVVVCALSYALMWCKLLKAVNYFFALAYWLHAMGGVLVSYLFCTRKDIFRIGQWDLNLKNISY